MENKKLKTVEKHHHCTSKLFLLPTTISTLQHTYILYSNHCITTTTHVQHHTAVFLQKHNQLIRTICTTAISTNLSPQPLHYRKSSLIHSHHYHPYRNQNKIITITPHGHHHQRHTPFLQHHTINNTSLTTTTTTPASPPPVSPLTPARAQQQH